MPFETFTGKRVVTKEPRVSIIKQGHFSFNTGAMQILKNKTATPKETRSYPVMWDENNGMLLPQSTIYS